MKKSARVIEYLSESCSADTVISLLMQFVSEENWEQLYDQLVNDGIPISDEDDSQPEEVREALDYVRENMDEDELSVYKATVSKNMNRRMPAGMGLDDGKVIDLLEEYGEDNGLSEGWWEEFGDTEDWLMWL